MTSTLEMTSCLIFVAIAGAALPASALADVGVLQTQASASAEGQTTLRQTAHVEPTLAGERLATGPREWVEVVVSRDKDMLMMPNSVVTISGEGVPTLQRGSVRASGHPQLDIATANGTAHFHDAIGMASVSPTGTEVVLLSGGTASLSTDRDSVTLTGPGTRTQTRSSSAAPSAPTAIGDGGWAQFIGAVPSGSVTVATLGGHNQPGMDSRGGSPGVGDPSSGKAPPTGTTANPSPTPASIPAPKAPAAPLGPPQPGPSQPPSPVAVLPPPPIVISQPTGTQTNVPPEVAVPPPPTRMAPPPPPTTRGGPTGIIGGPIKMMVH